jgi:hypothetical protein
MPKALAGIQPFTLNAPAVQPLIPNNAEPEQPAPTRPNFNK